MSKEVYGKFWAIWDPHANKLVESLASDGETYMFFPTQDLAHGGCREYFKRSNTRDVIMVEAVRHYWNPVCEQHVDLKDDTNE